MTPELMEEISNMTLPELDMLDSRIQELKNKANSSINKEIEKEDVPVRTTRGKKNC